MTKSDFEIRGGETGAAARDLSPRRRGSWGPKNWDRNVQRNTSLFVLKKLSRKAEPATNHAPAISKESLRCGGQGRISPTRTSFNT
jgi:hypothetical protein